MHKQKHTQLGRTAFIKGGNNEPTKMKHTKIKYKAGAPEFVRDDYEQGVAQKNKGASNTSLIVTHGRK